MPDHVRARRDQAAEWLRNHGVDPSRYPIDTKLHPAPNGWYAEIVAHNHRGRPYRDHSGHLATEVVGIVDDGNPPPPWLLAAAGLP